MDKVLQSCVSALWGLGLVVDFGGVFFASATHLVRYVYDALDLDFPSQWI